MPNRLSRFAEGVMEAAWLLALVVTPLFFDIFSARVFEPDKITLLRSLALVALAAWLVKLISEGGPRFDAIRSQYASVKGFLRLPLVIPVAALVIVYVIATIFSVSPYASLYGSYQRLQGTFTTFSYLILFVVLVANLRRRAQVDRAITLAIVAACRQVCMGSSSTFGKTRCRGAVTPPRALRAAWAMPSFWPHT